MGQTVGQPSSSNQSRTLSEYQGFLNQYRNGSSLVNPMGDPRGVAARLIRAQFKDWRQNFMPYELQALRQSSLTDPKIVEQQAGKAGGMANSVYDTLGGVEQRQLSSLGIQPTAEQSTVSARIRNLSRAAAVAGAQNQARTDVGVQDEMLALGVNPGQIGG